ncbi:hypothetical protein [Phytohalomonas tamaricis]|uniref:hypothetical protein n=1 Tax=Phytohalomonas tamaricis TaxID=2081032 RepID=UPI000D0B2E88|nr:hypothetical protein [Phytohalomonas tamaricis]
MAEAHAITPTSNPVPSRELRDALFNAELFDILLSSDTYTASSRLGKDLTTYAGFTKLFSDLRYQLIEDFDGSYQQALAASERAETAADQAETAATSSANSAQSSAQSAENSRTASEASGNILFYDTYADASAATLTEGQVVHVFMDETRRNRQSRYRLENGELVFKTHPNELGSFGLPYFGHSKIMTEAPLFEPNSNYASIGPLTIADGITVTIPENTDWVILSGQEQN